MTKLPKLAYIIAVLLMASCARTAEKPQPGGLTTAVTQLPAVKTQADTLSGTYVSVDFEGGPACPITITLSKKGTGYTYHIINNALDTIGPVDLSEGYLSLMGLKWSSYTNEDENPENEDIHNEMGFDKEKDTLLLQNYGNSMNNYVKLDCGTKFIKLVKQ